MDNIELVFPNSLQMGCCESPPFFCSGSENARDLMERLQLVEIPPHKFEELILKRIARTDVNKPSEGLVTPLEVYVDDYIAMSNDIRHSHLGKLSLAMLHGIHAIFSPPKVTGHTGFDPVAEKKMCDGYSIWDFYKEILGWDLNGIQYTIQLPPN